MSEQNRKRASLRQSSLSAAAQELSSASHAAAHSVRRCRASRGRAAPDSQSTSLPPEASTGRASPRASIHEASTSCQRPGYAAFTRAARCSGKAEIRQYQPPCLSHPVGSHAGIGYCSAIGSFNAAPKVQGFVGSHRQPGAHARLQSNPAFERTRTGRPLQALISFWALRVLPARAAQRNVRRL